MSILTNWEGTGLSHLGQARRLNEDSFAVLNHAGLWIVADGMGGHAGGEVASRLAVETITNFLEARLPHLKPSSSEQEALLVASIQAGQQVILDAAETEPALRGMGTTVVLLHISPGPMPRFRLLHVGDSRAYLLRDDTVRQLSVDHSLMERYLRDGLIAPEDVVDHPQRHVLTRALGTRRATPDLLVEALDPGDQLLLCTDGLTTMLDNARIADIWRSMRASPRSVCHTLVAEANAQGGLDNITVIVVAQRPAADA